MNTTSTAVDLNTLTIALYATKAHTHNGRLDDATFDTYVAEGTAALGPAHIAALARQLNGLDFAWAHGQLTDDDRDALRAAVLPKLPDATHPDLHRLERCYQHALGG
ncbi:hypothetical protein [Actinomadura violacea]|uniref:Uncharacterized protein n=1 Tax=Actinomadura violacea TaxID=2819934 RepID=A0ABS3RY58_9ACTN|nr:hypothetical protein [Actinomadura violacea]MBO2461690.1 hypothetical protein [Actinomadura violacea]